MAWHAPDSSSRAQPRAPGLHGSGRQEPGPPPVGSALLVSCWGFGGLRDVCTHALPPHKASSPPLPCTCPRAQCAAVRCCGAGRAARSIGRHGPGRRNPGRQGPLTRPSDSPHHPFRVRTSSQVDCIGTVPQLQQTGITARSTNVSHCCWSLLVAAPLLRQTAARGSGQPCLQPFLLASAVAVAALSL